MVWVEIIVKSFTEQQIEKNMFAGIGALWYDTLNLVQYAQNRAFSLNSENMFFECV